MRRRDDCCLLLTAAIALACASTRTLPSPHLTATQGDTSWPALPPPPALPSDSTFTVESPTYARSQLLYYRNIVGVTFNRSASGVTIRNLLARYQASVIGGVAGAAGSEYILQVPDPGTTLQALDSLLARLEREPAVDHASSVYYRTPGAIYSEHQGDTTRPAMPGLLNLSRDSTLTVRRPGDSLSLYYRNIVGIV